MPAVAKYDKNYVGPIGNIKKLLSGKNKGKLVYRKYNKDPISGIQSVVEFLQKPNETVNQFEKRVAQLSREGRSSARRAGAVSTYEFAKEINNWSDNWFKKNFKPNLYGPRDVDKFLKNLKDDWAKEVKEKGYKKVGFRAPSKDGYPNFFRRTNKYKIGSFPIDIDAAGKGERNIIKAFYENQLNTDPKFKTELKNYFDYFIRNKSGEANQRLKTVVPAASNAVYLLSDDSGLTGGSRSDMFSKLPAFTKDYNKYQKKYSKKTSSSKNLALIEEALGKKEIKRLTGYDSVRKLQLAEGNALRKLFDVSELPRELLYSVEHAQGLAVVARSGNKNLMRTAMTDLAGMTSGRNTELGWAPGTFERTRKNFVNQIQDGLKNKQNMNKKVKELNDFLFAEYKQGVSKNKKPYSIVNNTLQTSVISQATDQNQRFGQYFTELASKPEATQNLLKQIDTKPELTKFVQEGTDPILKSLRSTVIGLAQKNTDNFCNILSMRRADGGRMGFATGGNCATQVAEKFDADPKKFAQDVNKLPEQSGVINKAKSFASKFLSVAKKGGRFGAFAAVGAAGAGLVKEFRNDDPSTYLSSENQQKNMLIDMLEQPVITPTEEPSTALGDATLPAIGAVTAAGMIPGGAELYRQRTGAGNRKRPLGGDRLDAEGVKIPKKRVSPFRAATGPLSGVLGKGLAATGTPLGMLALEPLYIGQQIAEGDSLGEIATNPLNYLGPAFAGSLSKEATRFAGPTMSNIMRLGISPTTLKTVSRRFGLPGLALSAGISGYEMYQNKKAGRGLFDDG